MKVVCLLLILGLAIPFTRGDCWWTGCQPNNWATTGCAQYDRVEKGKEACNNGGNAGYKYNCCTKDQNSGGGGGDLVNFSQFSNGVTTNGYPAPNQEQFKNFNKHARDNGKISTVQEAAMALAQLLHESDGLRAKREYACQQSQCPDSYRTQGCDASGQYYYGRGYIQLSWCYNYRDASKALFNDQRLVTDPDQVARLDAVAWQTAFWFWGDRVHNKPGVQGGQFGATTKAINGGIECSSPGNQQAARRFQMYGKVRSAFGLQGAGDSSGCA